MSMRRSFAARRNIKLLAYGASVFALTAPVAAQAATVKNPLCPVESVLFNPGNGQDIVVPPGYTVSRFATGLNFPTGLAFLLKGDSDDQRRRTFEVYVLESGHGLPSRCNDQSAFGSGDFDPNNPFTPDILVFDQNSNLLRKLGKPTAAGGFQ